MRQGAEGFPSREFSRAANATFAEVSGNIEPAVARSVSARTFPDFIMKTRSTSYRAFACIGLVLFGCAAVLPAHASKFTTIPDEQATFTTPATPDKQLEQRSREMSVSYYTAPGSFVTSTEAAYSRDGSNPNGNPQPEFRQNVAVARVPDGASTAGLAVCGLLALSCVRRRRTGSFSF